MTVHLGSPEVAAPPLAELVFASRAEQQLAEAMASIPGQAFRDTASIVADGAARRALTMRRSHPANGYHVHFIRREDRGSVSVLSGDIALPDFVQQVLSTEAEPEREGKVE